MKNKTLLKIMVSSLCAVSLVSFSASVAQAQSKVVKKTVRKVVTPQISPATPPLENIPTSEVKEAPTAPSVPDNTEINPLKEDKGLFGWGINTDWGLGYLAGNSVLALQTNVVFSDPLKLGEKIGLAEDALEYKVGLGFGSGNDKDNKAFKSIFMGADAVLYLKEGSFFGQDPLLGAGLNYNLYGTGKTSGGLGFNAYAGMLFDFGLGSGKTAISLGYKNLKVAENFNAPGIFFAVSQPIKF